MKVPFHAWIEIEGWKEPRELRVIDSKQWGVRLAYFQARLHPTGCPACDDRVAWLWECFTSRLIPYATEWIRSPNGEGEFYRFEIPADQDAVIAVEEILGISIEDIQPLDEWTPEP